MADTTELKSEFSNEPNEEFEDYEQRQTPMDGWIALALYTDHASVCKLAAVVQIAIDKLGWEVKNTPIRWLNVRQKKERDLQHWIALHMKLLKLKSATDDIPF